MLAVGEVTELVSELNVRAPILREISSEKDHEKALVLMEELLEDYDTNLVAIEALSNSKLDMKTRLCSSLSLKIELIMVIQQ